MLGWLNNHFFRCWKLAVSYEASQFFCSSEISTWVLQGGMVLLFTGEVLLLYLFRGTYYSCQQPPWHNIVLRFISQCSFWSSQIQLPLNRQLRPIAGEKDALFSLWQFWDFFFWIRLRKKGRGRFWFRWDTTSLALSAAQQPPARTSCATCFTGSLSSLSGHEVCKW